MDNVLTSFAFDDPVQQAKMRFWGAALPAPSDKLLARLIELERDLSVATGCFSMDLVGSVIQQAINMQAGEGHAS